MLKWQHKTNTYTHAHQRQHRRDGDLYIQQLRCSMQQATYKRYRSAHQLLFACYINNGLIYFLIFLPFFSINIRLPFSHSLCCSLSLSYLCAARFIQCFTLLYFKAKRIQTMPCRLCTHKIKQIIYNCMIFPLYTASTQTVFHSSSLLIFLWRFPHAFVHFSIFSCLSLIVNTQTAKLCKQMEENTKETGMSMGRDGNSEQTLLVTVPFLMLLFLNYKNH